MVIRFYALRPSSAWLSLVCIAAIVHVCVANLMAVDLGEAYIKVAVARPGKGLELVPNEQSKRKTPAVVGFTTDGERLFGDAAVAYAAKAPDRVVFNARKLLGKCATDDETPFPFCRPATVSIKGVGEFNGVHLVAMLLAMARRHSVEALGLPVKDVAVTVPSSFDAVRRAAVCDAAAVAGLNCLGVVNANTAAAVKYALDGKARALGTEQNGSADKKARSKKISKKDASAHIALFYDVGASGAAATVARFHTASSGAVSRVEVLSHAWDPTLGGDAMDELLVAQLADAFDEQRRGTPEFSEDPRFARDLPRVMARLRKEARRAREILSANTERLVAVASLHQDMDLRVVLTRAELEKAAAPMLSAAPKPALRALSLAGVPPLELAAVVPFGGTARMPKIQSLVLDALGRASMNKSINGDEAAVMGTAFFAASLSSTYRVRKLDVMDRFLRSVSVEVERDTPSGSVFSSGKRRAPQNIVLFDAATAHMPAKKTISFSRVADFELSLYFDADASGEGPFPQRTLYATIKIGDVAKVLDKLDKQGGSKKTASKPTPRVALTFHLDRSGSIRVGTAESSVDETIVVEREVVVKKKTKSTESTSASPAASADASTSTSAAPETEAKEEKKEEKKTRMEKREQTVVHRHALTVNYVAAPDSIRAAQMSVEQLAAAKKVLQKLEDADRERAERSDALNALEGYILSARSRFREAEEGDDLYEVSTEEQRSSLLAVLEEAEDWMFSEEAEKTSNLVAKLKQVSTLVGGVERRAEERAGRPAAIEQMRSGVKEVLARMDVIEKLHKERNSGHEKKFADFRALAVKSLKWLDDMVAAQEELAATAEPAFTRQDITDKVEQMARAAAKLAKLELPPAPSQPPVEPKGESATTNNITADSDDKADSGGADLDPNAANADLGAKLETGTKDEL